MVMNRRGYRDLCRMLTQANLRSPKGEGRIAWDELEEFSEGLLALTGDAEGPLHAPILRGQRNEAEAVLAENGPGFRPRQKSSLNCNAIAFPMKS